MSISPVYAWIAAFFFCPILRLSMSALLALIEQKRLVEFRVLCFFLLADTAIMLYHIFDLWLFILCGYIFSIFVQAVFPAGGVDE